MISSSSGTSTPSFSPNQEASILRWHQAWVGELAENGTPFCVFADQPLSHGDRIAEFYNPSNKTVFVYASAASGSSIRRNQNRAEEFKYQPVDPGKLTRNSTVRLLTADGAQMNFLYFLPEERDIFVDLLRRIGQSKAAATRLLAHYRDYDEIFNAVVKTKEKFNVHNTAIALRLMADLAMQKLAELGDEQQVTEQHGKEQSTGA